ncbi:hypothetical protein fugu_016315, partial [Takifugu bimaculatus]
VPTFSNNSVASGEPTGDQNPGRWRKTLVPAARRPLRPLPPAGPNHNPPFGTHPVPPQFPRAFGRLVRPFVFTVGAPPSAWAAIWQYEALKSRVQSYFEEVQADWLEKTATLQKRGDVRKQSGAIMAILATVCTKMPEAKLSIIFLPMFTFTASSALKAIVAMDAAGVVLGWRFFDHAAHLGGALFGIWYALAGHELIWKNRENFVKLWHDLRTRGGGR